MADFSTNDLKVAFAAKLKEHSLSDELMDDLERIYVPMAKMICAASTSESPKVVGINGAQGAGKTTFCELLTLVLEMAFGKKVAAFSIDDIYIGREVRKVLAKDIHPLLRTRGVPGTHDVVLGLKLIADLTHATDSSEILIPRFDKASDEPFDKSEWTVFRGRPDVIIFDGWCVGAVPQSESELIEPINDLERDEDPDGTWRHFVNTRLATGYADLFQHIDYLFMLKVPSMDKVFEWRELQEQKLRDRNVGKDCQGIMTSEEVVRFVHHYERLTRHILAEMPDRADLTLNVNVDHRLYI